MDNVQEQVNALSRELRLQVIELLIKEDCLQYRMDLPGADVMLYMVETIDAMPVDTRLMQELFNDTHEYYEERGMFPHALTVGELKAQTRRVDYRASRFGWLPLPEYTRARNLPAFKKIDAIYKDARKVIAPKSEVECEALRIVNEATKNFTEAK